MIPDKNLAKWNLVQSFSIKATEKHFWKAVNIYSNRPHVINRRLIGVEILGEIAVRDDEHLLDIKRTVSDCENLQTVQEFLEQERKLQPNENQNAKTAVFKKLFPKRQAVKQSLEVVFCDYINNHTIFMSNTSENDLVPCFPYSLTFEENLLQLWVGDDLKDERASKSCNWIVSNVVPKLIKWMEDDELGKPSVSSLRLVSLSEYSNLYNNLKEKYGKQLVQMWPENTDPLKYVYEDIGIAAYLLLLWAGKPKQRFVDLGCGNGLLVHILNSEGHLGVGYDLRSRKIWSLYPPSTKLEVRTIIPSSENVFPDADWLIGNHSDELTVWIPVMAACSSYNCNFFLLPCCAYEFNGKKFTRRNTSGSQYSDFLNYVETVCAECDILSERDKLRIPSTKRICFVGTERSYPESVWKKKLCKLRLFIDKECVSKSDNSASGITWCPQFKPRSEEKVRNCTQIESDIRETIVRLVTEQLLAKKITLEEGWDFGGIVEISSLVKIIPPEVLKKLKNECGGLQTLLRNHHYIFQVQGGKVQFRVPTEKNKNSSTVWKKKPCWFYHNHPNSCPLSDEKCSFIHGS